MRDLEVSARVNGAIDRLKRANLAQQQGIVRRDALQKLGSAGFITGSILIAVAGVWVSTVDISDALEAQRQFAEQVVVFQVCALLIASGYWALMIGVAGVHGSITAAGSAWARLGLYFALIGTTLWTLGMILDVSYAAAIADWLAAPAAGKEAAYGLVVLNSPVGFGRGLFPMNVIVNWLAYAFLGLGMARSAVYPRLLGLPGFLLGVTGVLLGISQVFTGRESSFSAYMVLASFTTLWFLIVGIWIARKAW